MKVNFLYLMVLTLLLSIVSCSNDIEPPKANPPGDETPAEIQYRGVDLSFQPEIEDWNVSYFNANGEEIELLPWLSEKGVNLARLKLWHSPESEYNSLQSVAEYAARIKAANMAFLLDIHYSDTWADPGRQNIPVAWENLSAGVLLDSIYSYTFRVMTHLKDHNALPDMVQIGNETNGGFLWDMGRVGGTFDNNWPVYINLVKEAVKAVKDVSSETQIMFHFAGMEGAAWYFEKLTKGDVPFDFIGLSYYSLWHGNSMATFKAELKSFSSAFDQPIIIVETAYPFTLEWNDWTNNLFGLETHLIPGIPATPEGQLQFMNQIKVALRNLDEKGAGFCYWAPDWVAFKGPEATDGSPWENMTFFDFQNKALPVIDAFAE